MGNPANVALFGHRFQVWAKNTSTGSEIVVDRVQNIEPAFNFQTDAYYELGRVGRIGVTQSPPMFRIPLVQNLVNSMELEWVLTGKSIAPAGVASYNMGDVLTQAGNITAYVLARNQDGTILGEDEFTGCSVEELAFTFSVNGAITQNVSLVGKQGQQYQAGSVIHSAWGTLDDASLGGIHGKDARIWLASGSTATDRAFRLQTFTVRARFPSQQPRELGNRSIIGTLTDSPEITVDFDLLKADAQVADKLFTLTGGAYDYLNPLTPFDAYVRVFDPRDTEGLTTLKTFKIESVVPVSHTPMRAQVRGLATARYSLTSSKENSSGTGGLVITNANA